MNPQNDDGIRCCDACGEKFHESQLEFVESHSDVLMCRDCREYYIKCWDCMEWKDRREVTFIFKDGEAFCEDCAETLL